MSCGFRRDRQLEHLVSYRTSGQHRRCHTNECIYEDSSIVVAGIQRWHTSRMMCMRVTSPMHVDRTATVMVGRMVVWMRVGQRRADSGALDGQRQHDDEGLSGHGDIVGEHGHRVKGIWTASTRPLAPMATEPHAASFLNQTIGRRRRAVSSLTH